MALPSDRDGFLLGNPITIDREAFANALSILRAIKGDTAAMCRSQAKGVEIPRTTVATPVRASSAPIFTDAQLRLLGRQIANGARASQREIATPRLRRADGRFQAAAPAADQQQGGDGSVGDAAAATVAPAGANPATMPTGAGMPAVGDVPVRPAPVSSTPSAPRVHAGTAEPSTADALNRLATATPATPERRARSSVAAGSAGARIPPQVREVATPQRGSNGRFLGRAEREGSGAQGKGEDSRLAGAAERLGEAADSLRAAGNVAEAVDPTVTAVREVGEVVTPVLAPLGSLVKSGFGRLFGRGESEEIKQARPWYKRILKELVELRRNSEGGPAAAGGGRSGMLMPLLTSVAGFATPMLMGLLSTAVPLLLAGAGALLAGGIGWKIGEWINEKWGQQISDAVWNASEWVKEKWGRAADWFQSKWEGVTATFHEVSSKVGAAWDGLAAWGNEKLDTAKRYVSDKASQATRYVAATASSAKEAATVAGGRLVGALAPGYRHRESFDGIAGGAQMAALGTYTNAEADRIRELRSQGANTSANLKWGMPADVRDKIIAGARASGLDPSTMLRIAAMESGGNPNAVSATGAIGVYQFTGGTASAVGIRNRFDVDENIAGAMDLTKANAKTLQAVGQPVTPENLYLLHQLGPASGIEVIKGAASGAKVSDLSPAAQRAVKLNYGANSATATDYLAKNRKALDDRYARVVGGIPSNEIPSTIAAPLVAPAAAPAVPLIPRSAPLVLASAARPASAAVAAPKLVSMAPPPVPAPAPAPAILTPIGSNARAGSKTTVTLSAPVGQNLSDRTIAHVATGGLGAE